MSPKPAIAPVTTANTTAPSASSISTPPAIDVADTKTPIANSTTQQPNDVVASISVVSKVTETVEQLVVSFKETPENADDAQVDAIDTPGSSDKDIGQLSLSPVLESAAPRTDVPEEIQDDQEKTEELFDEIITKVTWLKSMTAKLNRALSKRVRSSSASAEPAIVDVTDQVSPAAIDVTEQIVPAVVSDEVQVHQEAEEIKPVVTLETPIDELPLFATTPPTEEVKYDTMVNAESGEECNAADKVPASSVSISKVKKNAVLTRMNSIMKSIQKTVSLDVQSVVKEAATITANKTSIIDVPNDAPITTENKLEVIAELTEETKDTVEVNKTPAAAAKKQGKITSFLKMLFTKGG